MSARVAKARRAFARQAWGDAYTLLAAESTLNGEDLERLAIAAQLTGRDPESSRAWEQAHQELARLGDREGAARCAVWLATGFMLRGDHAQANGWFSRVARLVDEAGGDCSAAGYLKIPDVFEALGRGDAAGAFEIAHSIVDIGRRFADADLSAIGTLGCGQAKLVLGETAHGMRLLDEAMVAVAAGEVAPIPAGIVYCAVIEACMDALDLRRAAEWTDALSNWCAAQPDLVPYRGQCLVHRSQVLQARGAWPEAAAEVDRARQRLSDAAHPALGLALYQRGELFRLRGDNTAAEEAYKAASLNGREPAPGLALLRLAEGKPAAAITAIRRMVDESRGQLTRPTMLAACVDIMLAAGEVEAARAAADELGDIARTVDLPLVRAMATLAAGAVLVTDDQAVAALSPLRNACAEFRRLEMPYDTARARLQIAVACRALGDHDSARFEFDAARATFEQLGARPDLERASRLFGDGEQSRPSELTDRECEVMRLLATGKTNREMAAVLTISEHTVARHVQNIFMKLHLSTRAAATAYAYDHHLV